MLLTPWTLPHLSCCFTPACLPLFRIVARGNLTAGLGGASSLTIIAQSERKVDRVPAQHGLLINLWQQIGATNGKSRLVTELQLIVRLTPN